MTNGGMGRPVRIDTPYNNICAHTPDLINEL